MLLQFSVTNHRSIKETAIISMKAAADKTMKESKRLIFRYDRKIPDYFSVAGAPCYENKTRSKKLNLDNKCFQQL